MDTNSKIIQNGKDLKLDKKLMSFRIEENYLLKKILFLILKNLLAQNHQKKFIIHVSSKASILITRILKCTKLNTQEKN